MATKKDFFEYIKEQLSVVGGVDYRPMMGEYIVYYKGKIIGGLYDNRFLIKPVKAAFELMPEAALQTPYDGAKPMLAVEDIDDKVFLKRLFKTISAFKIDFSVTDKVFMSAISTEEISSIIEYISLCKFFISE